MQSATFIGRKMWEVMVVVLSSFIFFKMHSQRKLLPLSFVTDGSNDPHQGTTIRL